MRPKGDAAGTLIRWVTDGFVVVYALWTLLCQAAARTGRGFSFVAGLSFLVPLLAAVILVLLARAGRRGAANVVLEPAPGPEGGEPDRALRAAGLTGAALLALFYVFSRSYAVFWAAACMFLLFFYLRHLRKPERLRPAAPSPERSETAVFFTIVLASAVLALVLHRPDYDDAFFLSFPVQALETPDAPLFEASTSLGFTPHPIVPTYSLHSVELAAGMLARLFGVQPITAAHMILPVIFAVVFVCGAARLLRFLLGRAWLLGLTALFFVLLFNGDSHWSYGNFGLVRYFHGKAFLATGLVPLLAAYALEFMSGERRGLWPLLFLGQAAAVGLNSAGLYVGPVVVGLTLFGSWRPVKRSTVRVLLGAFSAAYPLAMGLLLRFGPMRGNPFFLELNESVPPLTDALGMVFGSGVILWFWLFTLLGGWTAFRDALRRRWALGFALIFCLLFLNPLLNAFWARNLLGVMVKWRILWALPLPVWGAVLLAALSGTAAAALKRPGLKGAVLAAALALFGGLVTSRWTVSPANGVMVRRPSLKVPLEDYRLAREAAGMTDPGRGILAPETISVWVSTFTMRLKIIASREFSIAYLHRMTVDEEQRREVGRRLSLLRYVSGTARGAPEEEMRLMLKGAVADYDIQTVVLPRGNPWRREIESALREMGFDKRLLSSGKYTAYVNPRPGPAKRP